jgi:hypothetical protein
MPAIVVAAIGALPLLVDIIQGWMAGDTQETLNAKWAKVVNHFNAASDQLDANIAARNANRE